MGNKEVILSKEGYAKLEKKLENLKTVKRHEVADKIKTAREFGDLSENAEYDEAKQEQGFIEMEIREIEDKLKNAVVFDENEAPKDIIGFGTKVKVLDEEYNEEMEYTIVGSDEVDLTKGKISNESPIGKALLGKKAGESAVAEVPDGEIKLKVLAIL